MNRRTELRKRDRAARRLFVVDIENAAGSGMIDEESCRMVRDRIEKTYKPDAGDLTVIGV